MEHQPSERPADQPAPRQLNPAYAQSEAQKALGVRTPEELRPLFVAEVRALGHAPNLQVIETADAVEILISPFIEGPRRGVVKLIEKYVGFFRSVGVVECKHTREPAVAHWVIPNKHIIGADLSIDTFLAVTERVAQGIAVPRNSHF